MSLEILLRDFASHPTRMLFWNQHGKYWAPNTFQSPVKESPKTRYTIDDSVCPPTNVYLLTSVAQKACHSLPRYLRNKPIAPHTRQAFDSLVQQLLKDLAARDDDDDGKAGGGTFPEVILANFPGGIVLDSGCGTGRSTRLLAEIYPQHFVLGIDRSIARLRRSQNNQRNGDDDNDYDNNQVYVHPVAPNACLIRAELVDFWRCCLDHDTSFWTKLISHHYLLYPNPYPTVQRLTLRWYAHPSFPLLLQLNAQHLIIRSSWEGYLKEFSMAVEIASDYYNTRDEPSADLLISSSTTCTSKTRNDKNQLECLLSHIVIFSFKIGPRNRLELASKWSIFGILKLNMTMWEIAEDH